MDEVDRIIAYENGDLNEDEMLKLFASLVKSGLAWSLQGSYGRQAARLIEAGLITRSGEVTPEGQAAADLADG